VLYTRLSSRPLQVRELCFQPLPLIVLPFLEQWMYSTQLKVPDDFAREVRKALVIGTKNGRPGLKHPPSPPTSSPWLVACKQPLKEEVAGYCELPQTPSPSESPTRTAYKNDGMGGTSRSDSSLSSPISLQSASSKCRKRGSDADQYLFPNPSLSPGSPLLICHRRERELNGFESSPESSGLCSPSKKPKSNLQMRTRRASGELNIHDLPIVTSSTALLSPDHYKGINTEQSYEEDYYSTPTNSPPYPTSK